MVYSKLPKSATTTKLPQPHGSLLFIDLWYIYYSFFGWIISKEYTKSWSYSDSDDTAVVGEIERNTTNSSDTCTKEFGY